VSFEGPYEHGLVIGARMRKLERQRVEKSLLSGLQVPERIDRLAADTHLEVQVRPGREAGRADVADHLALCDLLPDRDRDLGLVSVRRCQTAAVVDDHEVAEAAVPAGVDDRPGRGGAN